jgi:hypothetical protein
MSPKIPAKLRKRVKSLIRPAACIVAWMLLFTDNYICRKDRNFLPVIFINLCFNDSLVFTIDPGAIRHHIEDPDIMPDSLFVWSGDWDRKIIDIWKHEKFEALDELLVLKKKYKDIGFYTSALDEDRQGNTLKRGSMILDSGKEIIEYLRKQERLFEKIKSEGFDIKKAPETGIAITREGGIVHYRQGHHTLAIAKIIGVEKVKVRIRAVHSQWLKKHLKKDRFNYLKSIRSGIEEIKNGS